MGRWSRTTSCERAAQWISLDLDDELSELERRALGRHLERCPGCATLRLEFAALTQLIRAAPLEPLATPLLVGAPRVSRRRLAGRAALAFSLLAALGASLAALIVPAPAPSAVSAGLGSLSRQQLSRFVHAEHVRIEPQAFAPRATVPKPPPLAARALF